MVFFTAGPIESALTAHTLGFQLNEEQQKSAGFGTFERAIAGMEVGLSNAKPFICGEQFTAVDIYVGCFLLYLTRYHNIRATPAIQSYLASWSTIPAIAEHLAN